MSKQKNVSKAETEEPEVKKEDTPMVIDFAGFSYDPVEYEYRGVKFMIRPYPRTEDEIELKSDSFIITGKSVWKKFNYCLTGWKGLTGLGGKMVPFTLENKKKLFDMSQLSKYNGSDIADLVVFVFSIINDLKKEEGGQLLD